jgi:hypothetical protein
LLTAWLAKGIAEGLAALCFTYFFVELRSHSFSCVSRPMR